MVQNSRTLVGTEFGDWDLMKGIVFCFYLLGFKINFICFKRTLFGDSTHFPLWKVPRGETNSQSWGCCSLSPLPTHLHKNWAWRWWPLMWLNCLINEATFCCSPWSKNITIPKIDHWDWVLAHLWCTLSMWPMSILGNPDIQVSEEMRSLNPCYLLLCTLAITLTSSKGFPTCKEPRVDMVWK